MRGTVRRGSGNAPGQGITPARAGNSPILPGSVSLVWDHPRACGEQTGCYVFCICKRGSPPRVRGTGLKSNEYCADYRITPARAGNSGFYIHFKWYNWDHPRACGEQFPVSLPRRQIPGSPPRVRGTGFKNPVWLTSFRITPARAGNRP